jgi:RecA-family ATPase
MTSRNVGRLQPASDEVRSIPLPVVNPADWQGQTLPVRKFLVPDVIPMGSVTLLSGDGGTGKSYLALQLATAAVCGETWLGMPVKSGPVLVLACEDDPDELHLRLSEIVLTLGRRFDELENMRIVSGIGEDAAIFEADEGASRGRTTARYDEIVDIARTIKPVLIVLDTAADIFAANENARRIVRQFIGTLTGLAIDIKCAIVLLAHPSKAGMASGENYSGSTAWNGSVRSRLSLEYAAKPKPSDHEDGSIDRNARILKHAKSNRGARLEDIKLRWEGGVFVRTGASAGTFDRALAASRADEKFLLLLDWHEVTGSNVSASRTANNFAPTTFSKHPDRDGISKAVFEAAMHRLLKAGRIRTASYGRPSDSRQRIVRALL